MVERIFNRMKHHRKAVTRYDRLDETFLANLQLILIAVYLKNTAKTQLVQTHPNPILQRRAPPQQARLFA